MAVKTKPVNKQILQHPVIPATPQTTIPGAMAISANPVQAKAKSSQRIANMDAKTMHAIPNQNLCPRATPVIRPTTIPGAMAISTNPAQAMEKWWLSIAPMAAKTTPVKMLHSPILTRHARQKDTKIPAKAIRSRAAQAKVKLYLPPVKNPVQMVPALTILKLRIKPHHSPAKI